MFLDSYHRSLVCVLYVSPESEGSVEDLGTVAADSAPHPHLQLPPVHLVLVLQVGHHLLTHQVFEY